MAQWGQDDWPVLQRDGPTVTTEPTKAVESVCRLLQAGHLSDRHHVTG